MAEDHVYTRLECQHRGTSITVCVRVHRHVPANLRCVPGGGVAMGGTNPLCDQCQRLLREAGRLTDVVDDLLRGGMGRWERTGAVVLAC
jgi:hypothetical protein